MNRIQLWRVVAVGTAASMVTGGAMVLSAAASNDGASASPVELSVLSNRPVDPRVVPAYDAGADVVAGRSEIRTDSLRAVSGFPDGTQLWLGDTDMPGEICLIKTEGDGVSASCNDVSILETWGALPLAGLTPDGKKLKVTALVEDGYDRVAVPSGEQGLRSTFVPIRSNAFQAVVDPLHPVVTLEGPKGERSLNFGMFTPFWLKPGAEAQK